MWMPLRLPTPHRWQWICRNLDTLDSIRKHMTGSSSLSGHHVDLSREICHWRHNLRQLAYLRSPVSAFPHVSLGEEALDPHLSSFTRTSLDNKKRYLEETTLGKPLESHHNLQPDFILAGEREEASDITKKTNSQLCDLTEDTVGRIHDAGAGDPTNCLHREYMKDVRTGTKAVLLTFLQRAGDTLSEVMEQEQTREHDDTDQQ